jgi:hypothetical protein
LTIALIAQVIDAMGQWAAIAQQLGVSVHTRQMIEQTLGRMAIENRVLYQ